MKDIFITFFRRIIPIGKRNKRNISDDNFRKIRIIIKLSELHHLYNFMLERGINNKLQTTDPWVIKHLQEFKCFSIDNVKRIYNELAIDMGLVKDVIE